MGAAFNAERNTEWEHEYEPETFYRGIIDAFMKCRIGYRRYIGIFNIARYKNVNFDHVHVYTFAHTQAYSLCVCFVDV